MSHITSQFIALACMGPLQLTPEQLDLQTKLMWDAVDFTRTLDCIVEQSDVWDPMDAYERTNDHPVVRRVLESYMVERGEQWWESVAGRTH